jgi:hypothetical protein
LFSSRRNRKLEEYRPKLMNAVALGGGSLRYRPFAGLRSGSDFAARKPTLPLAVDMVWHGWAGQDARRLTSSAPFLS